MEGSLKELSQYRFERAEEELVNSYDMLELGKYRLSLNRSYYSIFHAMRAVNALDGFDASKHSSVIAHFNQFHVKIGDVDRQASRIIRGASEMRERADYDDFFIASKAAAQTQADNAKVFLENVRAFLAASDVLNS